MKPTKTEYPRVIGLDVWQAIVAIEEARDDVALLDIDSGEILREGIHLDEIEAAVDEIEEGRGT